MPIDEEMVTPSKALETESLDKLKQLLSENEKLKKISHDEKYLLRFLYGSKFNIEVAYEKVKSNYELASEYPEWFPVAGPLSKKSVIDSGAKTMLPGRDKEGRLIYLLKSGNVDTNTMKFFDLLAIDDIWLEASLMDNPQLTEKGLAIIVDVSNYPWKVVKWFTPEVIKISIKKLLALPFNEYRFHFINKSTVVHITLKLFWPFLPSFLKDMMKFHFDDWDSFYEHFDKSVIPTEYNGTCNIDYQQIYKTLYNSNEEVLKSFKLHRDRSLFSS